MSSSGTNTALWGAARVGDAREVERVINCGAQVDSRNPYGWAALLTAAYNGHTEVLKTLLRLGADVDVRDNDGWTALHYAAQKGRSEDVERLLQNSAAIDGRNDDGWSALTLAAAFGDRPTVECLLDYGADVDVTNDDGKTALDLARACENSDVADVLQERAEARAAGAGVAQQGFASLTALFRSSSGPREPLERNSQGGCRGGGLLAEMASLRLAVEEGRTARRRGEARVQELSVEVERLQAEKSALTAANEALHEQLTLCHGEGLDHLDLDGLRQLEEQVRLGLEKIVQRREDLQNALDAKFCVVCEENPKNVVLLPCRHLCLCKKCSELPKIFQQGCPLCRAEVCEVMAVYA